jgi:hypothetical protein
MAYDASNLQNQLISIQGGTWVHAVASNPNVVPTIANGKVYVASNKQLEIFGLLAARGSAARAALPQPVVPSKPDVIACPPSDAPLKAVGAVASSTYQWYGTVCHVSGAELQLSLRSGHSITIDISEALAQHRLVPLTPGRVVRIEATIDEKGAAHAFRISPSHMLSPLTPADR